jgi:CheY-like chemotaxis protein
VTLALRSMPRATWVGWSCVVDGCDDAAVRLICPGNPTADGLQVREAGEGLDALEQARCERPDLVLIDVRKPGLGRFQLARLSRRARARTGRSGFG